MYQVRFVEAEDETPEWFVETLMAYPTMFTVTCVHYSPAAVQKDQSGVLGKLEREIKARLKQNS